MNPVRGHRCPQGSRDKRNVDTELRYIDFSKDPKTLGPCYASCEKAEHKVFISLALREVKLSFRKTGRDGIPIKLIG